MFAAAASLLVAITFSAYAVEAASADAQPATDEINRTKLLDAYMLAASADLGAAQLDALLKIKDDDRRYLAMTYYLRAGSSIASRWSWTDEQIRAYEKSPEYSAALAEIQNISARFATDNSGYSLYANTRIRSLEAQLSEWEKAASVGESAAELREAALATLLDPSYGQEPNETSIKRFCAFLNRWRASHWPTFMAPGLSMHGRGRAFDFQIRDESGHTVADTDASTVTSIWEGEQRWAEKLSHAVHAAGTHFTGPLLKPYEPWHYEYRPEAP